MIKIFGGGMAGLLSAHVLRKHRPVIHEAQPNLPHNHEALLRFRDDKISELTGIPFKKVKVLKGICLEGELITEPNLRLGNMYSLKTNGTVRGRSIMNLDPSERFIAPPDFVERLSEGVEIVYASPLTSDVLKTLDGPSVSTIPMPVMMKMVQWPEMPSFQFKSIWALTADIVSPEVDVYQTLYYPGEEPYYRCSVTGGKLIVEFQSNPLGSEGTPEMLTPIGFKVLEDFGIDVQDTRLENVRVKEQKFGKLVPIDESQRRSFIMAMSECYQMYALGRFATWKPSLLMHDVVGDAQVVAGLIQHKDKYSRQLAWLKEGHRL